MSEIPLYLHVLAHRVEHVEHHPQRQAQHLSIEPQRQNTHGKPPRNAHTPLAAAGPSVLERAEFTTNFNKKSYTITVDPEAGPSIPFTEPWRMGAEL